MATRQVQTLTEAVDRVVELEEELARARAERDAAIVRRVAQGNASLRTIAAEARLSYESVRRIIAASESDDDGLLTVNQAAKRSGVRVDELLRRALEGELPVVRGEGGVRFRAEDLDRL